MRRDGLQQLHEHLGGARHHIAGLQIIFLAGEIADQTARFQYQQTTGGNIPRIQTNLEESVGMAGGQPGQVERSRAGTAQSGGFLHQILEHRGIGVEMGEIAVRKTGADQRALQFVALGNPDAPFVQEGATTTHGGIEIVAHRIVDHRDGKLPPIHQRNRNAILRKAVQKIGGAVERINDPLIFGIARRSGRRRLLG